MANQILFSEKQRFTQWWLWLILLAATVMPLYGLYHEFRAAEPFSDAATNMGIILSVIVIFPLVALFVFMRLETKITEAGIDVKLLPLHFKSRHFSWADLREISVREYNPISEYGGWGWRLGFEVKAYNISGNQGIQLIFKKGKKLLICTQKPAEAAAALKQAQPIKA